MTILIYVRFGAALNIWRFSMNNKLTATFKSTLTGSTERMLNQVNTRREWVAVLCRTALTRASCQSHNRVRSFYSRLAARPSIGSRLLAGLI